MHTCIIYIYKYKQMHDQTQFINISFWLQASHRFSSEKKRKRKDTMMIYCVCINLEPSCYFESYIRLVLFLNTSQAPVWLRSRFSVDIRTFCTSTSTCILEKTSEHLFFTLLRQMYEELLVVATSTWYLYTQYLHCFKLEPGTSRSTSTIVHKRFYIPDVAAFLKFQMPTTNCRFSVHCHNRKIQVNVPFPIHLQHSVQVYYRREESSGY